MKLSLAMTTPTVKVFDNRNLNVRSIAYHWHPDSPDAVDSRITRHQYSPQGFVIRTADPRLHEAARANFSYQSDLNGHAIRTCGADSGRVLNLNDVAGRSLSRVGGIAIADEGSEDRGGAVLCSIQYEHATLAGRPEKVTEQRAGATTLITERFQYAGNSDAEKAHNLAGRCAGHFHTAGLLQIDSISLFGAQLSVTHRLLKEASKPDIIADWQGVDAAAWSEMLDAQSYKFLTIADSTGAALSRTDAMGNIQWSVYDLAGSLFNRRLKLEAGVEMEVAIAQTYSASGQLMREEHSNGVVVSYTYNAQTHRLNGIKIQRSIPAALGARVLQDLHYKYDPAGNVLSECNDAEKTRFWRNQEVKPESNYVYDSLYQLVCVSGREMATGHQRINSSTCFLPGTSDDSAYVNYTRTYQYDDAGNLMRICHHAPASGNHHSTAILISNRSNRGVLGSLTEDPAEVEGFFTAGGQQKLLQTNRELFWTSRNTLHKVTPVVRVGSEDDVELYRYDACSQRVLKFSERAVNNNMQSLRVHYLPGLELHTKYIGGVTREHLQAITLDSSGRGQVRVLHWECGKPQELSEVQVRFSYGNLIGSVGLEIDGEGNVISAEEFYPYGGTSIFSARNVVEVSYKVFRYSGKERDATGLYYYGCRYYQWWAGRWLSSDPFGALDGVNLYRMVRNNPATLVDKNGLQAEEASVGHAEEILDFDIVRNFEPARGDLIYGLSFPTVEGSGVAPRHKYITDLIHNAVADGSTPLTIDRYNNAVSGLITMRNASVASDMRREMLRGRHAGQVRLVPPVSPKQFGQRLKIPSNIATDLKSQHKFPLWAAYFQMGDIVDKFNVAAIYDEVKLSPSKTNYHQWDGSLDDPKGVAPNLFWKRASKLGLAMAANGSGHIHFVLDEIDIAAVISKDGEAGQSITASELRYAFRNREQLEGRISFYKNNIETEAPWETNFWEWSSYVPKKGAVTRKVLLTDHRVQ
ncbi:RHS repeat domain-containing protein [Pseudomonas sp. CC120222-01a]|uniref:RHS repeat domain-containing protein n=1 Tax=Pseudomonas sp. CC120222-01a TaxID=1378075 RepID=UPI000D929692|nr:RHS repeat domain-containing protein [Pseudomonas sp. CC120222-01a]PVZ32465.1 RHS repeat-associated protein [Pseudomonas sp. CC120222-01a]